MPGIIVGMEIINNFIGVAKELAKLPALVLPQYQQAAKDLYEICQKLLKANENLSRWLHRFRYLDLSSPSVPSISIQEYRIMKSGPEFQQLKFSCHDIANIYYRDIASKIGSWLSDRHKMEEAEGIFTELTDADSDMIAFVFDDVVRQLDTFVDKVENEVDASNLDKAEELRLEFKSKTKEIAHQLEKFSNDLSELVISFAKAAKIPVTLGNV